MRDTERLGNTAGVVDVLAGAAGTCPVRRGAVIVKLQGDADDIIAFALQDAGNDRRIDAARHGDDDAGVFWASGKIEAVHGSFNLRGTGCQWPEYRSSAPAAPACRLKRFFPAKSGPVPRIVSNAEQKPNVTFTILT